MIENKTIEPEGTTTIVMSRDAIDARRRVVDLMAGGEGVIQLEPASEPEPGPQPAPAWPTAPHVWWDGGVWALYDDGEYRISGDYWHESHLDNPISFIRDEACRFAREAVPVTLVPSAELEAFRASVARRECHRTEGALIAAADVLGMGEQ